MHTRNVVNFVRPVDLQDLKCTNLSKEDSEQHSVEIGNIDTDEGDKIREFYESLVSSTSKTPRSPEGLDSNGEAFKQQNLELKPSFSAENRLSNELLKCSQNGDLNNTQLCIERGANINFQDAFGWTALMSASCGGHHEVVCYLLDKGANSLVCDKVGKCAKMLAQEKRHWKVVSILERHNRPSSVTESDHVVPCGTKQCSEHKRFYCSVCKCEFKDTTEARHATSTVHLFNLKLEAKTTTYFIPESNRGFQMMVKSGWNVDKGLGSEGQGRKFPVRTVMKRDRLGLGSTKEEKAKSRVTHFSANDQSAVKKPKVERKMRNATLSKKKRKKKECKEKEWERKLRIYMNSE
ncbi:G patch domain and ankyrin repeat-containing protein 1-like [Liolophura sinensis]|uniref:G patch domain and ankyrin repeat-containing protein 1-like n=1 Tax=Liolophura sinensis TaxID=3198878 RepID=UPI0031593DB0